MTTSKYKIIFLSIFMLAILACYTETPIGSNSPSNNDHASVPTNAQSSRPAITAKQTSFKVFVDDEGAIRFPGMIKQLEQKITDLGQNALFSVETINQENIDKISEKEIIFCAFLVTSERYEIQSRDTCEPLMKDLNIQSNLVLLGFSLADLSLHTPSKKFPYFFRHHLAKNGGIYDPLNPSSYLEESESNEKQFQRLAKAIENGKFF